MLKDDSYFADYERLGRNRAVLGPLRFMEFGHLRDEAVRSFSSKFADLARAMLDALPDDPELTVALQKLREAKDRAVELAAVSWAPLPVAPQQVYVKPTDE